MSERIRLIGIEKDGSLEESDGPALPHEAKLVCESFIPLYQKSGFEPPWMGYLALRANQWIGTCAFKTPPGDNKVEIAYFTFPDFERKGVATQMASMLINIAAAVAPGVQIMARTLPEENASTKILQNLGFKNLGRIHDAEHGAVWEWALGADRQRKS